MQISFPRERSRKTMSMENSHILFWAVRGEWDHPIFYDQLMEIMKTAKARTEPALEKQR